MRLLRTPRVLAARRLLRIPLILTVLYFAFRLILAALSDRHGFGSPDGVSLEYLIVAFVVIALRVVLLALVPGYLAYRAVAWAINHALREDDSSEPLESDLNSAAATAVPPPDTPHR
ncbi:hypothetical protein GPX89_06365 [Nocardia sp. ET3-3]|uniref:DUF4282 domain-containing protein n=1 Tax=Nocardia terrae TaxID=2675851 RepID=A0A7K1URD4_9NOCA|nr:hypothetical protein [Nocardia terrae]MVU76867.1 hypothetical protein [Nocardia terrae]